MVDVGTIDWFRKKGYAIGVIHNHRGGTAQSLDDVFYLLTLASSGGGNGPSQSQESTDLYWANVFIAVVTTEDNYVVMVNDWATSKKQKEFYEKDKAGIDKDLNNIRYNLTRDPYNYTEGQAFSFALLNLLGNSINLYKAPKNSTAFVPLSIDKEALELNQVKCP